LLALAKGAFHLTDQHEQMHERYNGDETRLLATATDELWTSDLLDAITDVASPR